MSGEISLDYEKLRERSIGEESEDFRTISESSYFDNPCKHELNEGNTINSSISEDMSNAYALQQKRIQAHQSHKHRCRKIGFLIYYLSLSGFSLFAFIFIIYHFIKFSE
jgi:hypothetical protein